ncbi:hypothetical protein [Thermosulfurimonas dismutans]|uniref:hypothetical protein n=1 Tax=Thermosulfurimonas dismutans TaxID=999894 RepID=UPI003CC56B52
MRTCFTARARASLARVERIPARRVLSDNLPLKGIKLKVLGLEALSLNREKIDLSAIEQLVCPDQVRTLGLALLKVREKLYAGKLLYEAVLEVEDEIKSRGLLGLSEEARGDLAFVRRFEVAAALNRLRTLKARPER